MCSGDRRNTLLSCAVCSLDGSPAEKELTHDTAFKPSVSEFELRVYENRLKYSDEPFAVRRHSRRRQDLVLSEAEKL